MAKDPIQDCKFFLLRYMPDAVKGEFVNIGVVLLPPQAPPELRFSKDWSRVTALDPQADTELLQTFRDELSRQGDKDLLLHKIEDSFSNALQASEHKACLTTAPSREADELARIYLQAPSRRASRQKGARHKILQSMQKAFTQAGIWRIMQKEIPLSRYTRAGDPLKIDCGYQSRSTIKMFHATSLRNDATAAKVLAFSYPELSAGIERMDRAHAELTAIIEDGLEKNEQTGFALETLQGAGVQIAMVSELAGFAAMAAKELETFRY